MITVDKWLIIGQNTYYIGQHKFCKMVLDYFCLVFNWKFCLFCFSDQRYIFAIKTICLTFNLYIFTMFGKICPFLRQQQKGLNESDSGKLTDTWLPYQWLHSCLQAVVAMHYGFCSVIDWDHFNQLVGHFQQILIHHTFSFHKTFQ